MFHVAMEEPRRPRARPNGVKARLESLDSLLRETAALFHRMRHAAEELHRQGEMSGGRRGVLGELDRLGSRTVPQMARARSVSRQHIQVLVNGLARDGYVELLPNPEHERSRLVRLTASGRSVVGEMNRREASILPLLNLELTDADLDAAATALRAVRQALDSDAWRRQVRRFQASGRPAGARSGTASRILTPAASRRSERPATRSRKHSYEGRDE